MLARVVEAQDGGGVAVAAVAAVAAGRPVVDARGGDLSAAHTSSTATTRMASATAARSDMHAFQPIDTWSSWPALVETVSHDDGAAWVRIRLTIPAAV